MTSAGDASHARGDGITLLHVATVPILLRNFYLPYATHFRSLGWRVVAAARDATREGSLLASFDEVVDLPISRSMRDPGNYTRALVAIRRSLETRPDIVHVHSPIASFLVRLAARTLPADERPIVVYTVHGFHFHTGGSTLANVLYGTAERVAGRWTDRLIVMNDEDEDWVRSRRILPTRRLVRMPGVGLDVAWYGRDAVGPESVASVRSQLGIGPSTPLFVVVGELHPRKRQTDVVEALARMSRTDAVLALVGDGTSRARLEDQIARRGLTGRVHIVGFVEDVRPWIVAADATVLASEREGLPRAILESLALETPVVATAARGSVELVGGGCGRLVPVGGVAELARAMESILERPAEARAMARRGRERVLQSYRLGDVLVRHEQLYADVLRERATARSTTLS